MPRNHEAVFLRDKDFLEKGYHWEPGYYFYDEEGDLYGPFLSAEQGECALKLYLQQLMAGEAPTQLLDPGVPTIPGLNRN